MSLFTRKGEFPQWHRRLSFGQLYQIWCDIMDVDVGLFMQTPAAMVSRNYRLKSYNSEIERLDIFPVLFSAHREQDRDGSSGSILGKLLELGVTTDFHEQIIASGASKYEAALQSPGKSGKRTRLEVIPVKPTKGDIQPTAFLWLMFEDRIQSKVSDFSKANGLTVSETRILDLLSKGVTARSISVQTGRTYGTTRWHLQNILSKTRMRSQTQLISELLVETYPG